MNTLWRYLYDIDLEQQSNNGLEGSESNDRLSSLHDSILHQILSFLPTREVVRTGILSQRWKSLWIGLSIFDISDFRRPSIACWNFVERFLLRNGSITEQFKLRFSSNVLLRDFYPRVQSMISSLVSHKIPHLDISLLVEDQFALPSSIFDCQSLCILKLKILKELQRKLTLELPVHISLPRLKVLHLCDFALPNAVSIEKLFSCCPVLEELNLERCRFLIHQNDISISIPSLKRLTMVQLRFCEFFQNANSIEKLFSCCHVLEELTLMDCKWIHFNSITISIPSLKRLTMGVEKYDGFVDVDNSCYITIESPALLSFNYTGFLTNHFYLTKISSSSIKAYIHMRNYYYNKAVRGLRVLHLVKFFQGLENIVSLTISNETAEELSVADTVPDHFPVFHHLKYLNLNMKVKGSVLSGLLKFFYFMPNLGTIEFSEGVHQDIRISGLKRPKALPNCFLSSLKDLRLNKFRGDGHEFYFLTSFLQKVVSLQRINITTYGYINRQQLRKKVEDLSTRFKHCAIIVQ